MRIPQNIIPGWNSRCADTPGIPGVPGIINMGKQALQAPVSLFIVHTTCSLIELLFQANMVFKQKSSIKLLLCLCFVASSLVSVTCNVVHRQTFLSSFRQCKLLFICPSVIYHMVTNQLSIRRYIRGRLLTGKYFELRMESNWIHWSSVSRQTIWIY